jgi:hypothetical protein
MAADQSWAVEEYAEDAVRAYLASKIEASVMNFYTAWTDTEIKYPCAVVHAGTSRNVENMLFDGRREIDMSIAVLCEATPAGAVTARNRNRNLRALVMDALAQTALHDDINDLNPDGVTFSLAVVDGLTRSVDEARRLFVSEITLTTIASAEAI